MLVYQRVHVLTMVMFHPPPGPGSLYRGISAAWLRQATFGTLRHGGYGVLEAAGKDARNQAG